MSQFPARRFRGVSPNSLAQIQAANLRGLAEGVVSQSREALQEAVKVQLTQLVDAQFQSFTRSLYNQGAIYQIPFIANIAPVLLRPAEERTYVFIQNQSGAAQLILGIGKAPGSIGGTPTDGLIIGANLGFYEPLIKPQQDLWIAASANTTPGILLISLPSW